jgi:TRAP-type uncharacterized transport system substrate-binding protein
MKRGWKPKIARLAFLCAGLALHVASAQPLFAQGTQSRKAAAPPEAQGKTEANQWTIGLAGGLLEGTFIRYAADIAKVLDDGDKLRVIPLVTYGAVGNVTDLLHLKGVDAAITQADVLDHFRRELKLPNIDKRIHYISPLFNSEVHIYARGEFATLKDLTGRKVAFNTRGSAANLTGQVVFERLGIKVEPIFVNNAIALERMRSNEIAAVVHVVGKPNDLFAKYKPEPGFHFLPIEYDSKFTDYYLPTQLNSEDYPNLIPSGASVSTIAVPTVLAVFNWPNDSPRYQRIARFVESYFAKFSQLQQPPFQPKWKEINVAGTVPGWTRYRVAEEMLAKTAAMKESNEPQLRADFDAFLSSRAGGRAGGPLTPAQRETLFKEFMQWQRR